MNAVKTILIAILSVTSTIVFGQISEKYESYQEKTSYEPGYIEKLDGDRLAGLIKSPRVPRAHAKVVFVSKRGVKSTYHPSQLKGYGTEYEQYESNRTDFLKVVTKSNGIGLYELNVNTNWSAPGLYGEASRMYASLSASYYIKRTWETQYIPVEKKQFQETFLDYFNDCSVLQTRINDRKFTYENAYEMVKFYQYSCRKQEAMNMQTDRF